MFKIKDLKILLMNYNSKKIVNKSYNYKIIILRKSVGNYKSITNNYN